MFKSTRLYYTHITLEDSEFTFKLRNGNFEHSQTLLVSPLPTSLLREQEWIRKLYEDQTKAYFLIWTLEKDARVGYCFLQNIDFIHRNCSVGIMISEEKNGHGYATESINFLTKYGMTHLGLHKMCATVIKDNRASMRVFEKNGYVVEGVLKNHYLLSGEWKDCCLLAKFADG